MTSQRDLNMQMTGVLVNVVFSSQVITALPSSSTEFIDGEKLTLYGRRLEKVLIALCR